jgi:hypothetical protein
MKIDCQWLNTNLENYFCDRLSAEQIRLTAEHLEGCASCRKEVESLRNVDGVIKQLFSYRLSQAQSSPQPSRRRVGFSIAFASAAVAMILVFVFTFRSRPEAPPLPVVQEVQPFPVGPASTPTPPAEVKSTSPGSAARAKDKPATEAAPPALPAAPASTSSLPFAVIDPAGYSTTVESYKGNVLVFGVWSADRPEAVQNLERIYREFGPNPRVRVLGVANRRQARIAGTSFPIVFNDGSQLFGAVNSQFVVVDPSSRVRFRGSLMGDGDAIVTKIREQLGQLGIK